MPAGHVCGHVSLTHHLTFVLVSWTPRVADKEGRRLFCGVAVIVSKDMGVGLQKEADVGVADPLADHLRIDAGFGSANWSMPTISGVHVSSHRRRACSALWSRLRWP
jgi:hypothetical protein